MAHKAGSLHHEMVAQLESSTLAERFAVDFNADALRWEISFSNISKDEFFELFMAGLNSLSSGMANKWKMRNTSEGGCRALQFVNLSDNEARQLSLDVAARFHQAEK